MKTYIEFETPAQATFMKTLLACQLSYDTDEQKEMLLSIAKKVYTKCRTSRKLPYDVIEEMGQSIKDRNYYYMSMTFSKVGLQMLAKNM
jgi:hypothetical protein